MDIPSWVKTDEVMALHTSWLVGGKAKYFAEPKSIDELRETISFARKSGSKVFPIGGGTNLLVSDDGVPGLVISMARLNQIELIDDKENLEFWAWSGTPKSELLRWFLRYQLAPAAFLSGLPGQVGGGVVMNAGVSENLHPREFMEIVKAVEVLDFQNKIHIFPKDKLTWSYRHCSGWGDGIVTRALISWPLEIVPDIKNTVKELNSLRMKKQPLEFPSCGSVFRNPLPESAGALIERAGLKGRTHGGAQISLKHGNFIVNRGHATCRDIVTLMNVCTSEVKEKFGVDLKSEVVMMGPMPK